MIELILLVIRAVQMLFSIIVLGLSGYLASQVIISISRISFMVFVSVWTFVVLIFLILAPRFFNNKPAKLAAVGLDLLTALFWFAGFIALAVLYHDGFATDYYYSIAFCDAIDNGCSVMEAAVVFGAFEWALFSATTALSGLEFFRNNKSGGQPSAAPHATA